MQFAVRAALTAIVVYMIYSVARQIDLEATRKAVAAASPLKVALCAALNVIEVWIRAAAFSLLLSPTKLVPTRRLFPIALTGLAASNLLPWRLGDLVPIALIRVQEGIPAQTVVAATMLEKCSEALALFALAILVPWAMPNPPEWLMPAIAACGLGGLLLLVVAWVASRAGRLKTSRLSRFVEGVQILRDKRRMAAVVGLSLLQWVADIATIWVILDTVGIQLHWTGPIVIELALTASALLPSTPGHIGTVELGAVLALRALGVGESAAVAFTLVYRLMEVLPITLLGLFAMRSFGVRSILTAAREEEQRASQAEGGV
jgi:uncharacterized membrane protein YbhN (UPF0104 family)